MLRCAARLPPAALALLLPPQAHRCSACSRQRPARRAHRVQAARRAAERQARAATKKVYIRTFGCQMNEYDSDKMADVLRAAEGYEPTDDPSRPT
jgi:hypothetical protein